MKDLKLLDIDLFVFAESESEDSHSADKVSTEVAENGDSSQSNDLFAPVEDEAESVEAETEVEEVEIKEEANKEEPVDLESEFEALVINGKFKDVYKNRVRTQVQDRHKTFKQIQTENETLKPLASLILETTGKDKLKEAVDSFLEQNLEDMAYKAGFQDPAAYKRIRELESKLESVKFNDAPETKDFQQQELVNSWRDQEADMQTEFPGFKIEDYLPGEKNQSPEANRFAEMLQTGFTVESAYATAYRKQMLEKAKQEAISITTQNIAKKKSRASESAANKSSASAYITKKDFMEMTDEEFDRAEKLRKAGKLKFR